MIEIESADIGRVDASFCECFLGESGVVADYTIEVASIFDIRILDRRERDIDRSWNVAFFIHFFWTHIDDRNVFFVRFFDERIGWIFFLFHFFSFFQYLV